MSLQKFAAVATREVARCARAGPSSPFLGTWTAPPSRFIVQHEKNWRGFSAVSPLVGQKRALPTESNAFARAGIALRTAIRYVSSKPGKPKLTEKAQKAFAKVPPGSATPIVTKPIPTTPTILPTTTVTRTGSHSLHLAVENAYLNWIRNGITATGLGMAFVHFRLAKDSAEFSIGGAVIHSMGAAYVALGSISYLSNAIYLRKELALTPLGKGWYVLNATWPVMMYTVGMMCILDSHPEWLLTLLAMNVDKLPPHWQARCISILGEKRTRDNEREASAKRKKVLEHW